MSSHKPVPQVYDGVSTEDVPSAGFGWSRISRSGVQIAGWISVIFMIGFNFGNHKGHVETVWLAPRPSRRGRACLYSTSPPSYSHAAPSPLITSRPTTWSATGFMTRRPFLAPTPS